MTLELPLQTKIKNLFIKINTKSKKLEQQKILPRNTIMIINNVYSSLDCVLFWQAGRSKINNRFSG